MEVGIPAHLPTVFKDVQDSFELYTTDLGYTVDELSRVELNEAIDDFCSNHPEYKTHQSSKRLGRLIYNESWDLITLLYDTKQRNNTEEISHLVSDQSSDIYANEFFHSV